MNAITPYQQPQALPQVHSIPEMERIALAIAKGRLFGSDDPNAVLTLCLVAQAEGKHPGLVMQQYHIIQGKPAKKAEAMLVDFLASGGKVEWHQLDATCADATFSHPAGGTVRITWDDERVKQAQLGGNPMHKKYPRQMKRSRCISEGVRTVFPGATSGMYVPEEVQDMVAEQPTRATPPAPQAQRARDLKAEKPEQPALVAPDDARAKAETWASEHIECLKAAFDQEEVERLRAKGKSALAKLQKQHPDLYARVIEADPQSAIQPATDTSDAGNQGEDRAEASAELTDN